MESRTNAPPTGIYEAEPGADYFLAQTVDSSLHMMSIVVHLFKPITFKTYHTTQVPEKVNVKYNRECTRYEVDYFLKLMYMEEN